MSHRKDDHWLARPESIRKLWIAFIVLLLATVVAQAIILVKGYFGPDGWFGFGAAHTYCRICFNESGKCQTQRLGDNPIYTEIQS